MPNTIKKMLNKNKEWAENLNSSLAKIGSPSVFLVSCCDGRVVPSKMYNFSIGEVFVQTNIANQVRINDINAMSSLEYAVSVLGVKHIVVCGHTHCRGVQAAMSDAKDIPPSVADWIKPIKGLYRKKRIRS